MDHLETANGLPSRWKRTGTGEVLQRDGHYLYGLLIIYVYDMHAGEQHLSVALATVEFHASDGGTEKVFTKQDSFLDGEDGTASREGGTAAHLDRLAEVLRHSE